MNEIEIAKVLFGQYSDCDKVVRTDTGLVTDEQRAISENNFIELMHNFCSVMHKKDK